MAIQVFCPGCAKSLKAPAEMAGKQARCPHCRTSVQVPATPVEDDAGYALSSPPPPRPSFLETEQPRSRKPLPEDSPAERISAKSSSLRQDAAKGPLQGGASSEPAAPDAPAGRGRARHWWFVLTLVPLAFSLLGAREDIADRIQRTIAAHPEVMEKVAASEAEGAEVFALLPEGKLAGAHLSRRSWMHWFYGLAAAALFYGLIMALFEREEAKSLHVIVAGATTATIGIFMLLAFQWIAEVTQHVWLHGRSVLVLLFYLVKLIGFSYRAALDPSNGFLSSFFGFTLGVGLCEEFTKAAPVFFRLHDESSDRMSWRRLHLGAGQRRGLRHCRGHSLRVQLLQRRGHVRYLPSAVYLVRRIARNLDRRRGIDDVAQPGTTQRRDGLGRRAVDALENPRRPHGFAWAVRHLAEARDERRRVCHGSGQFRLAGVFDLAFLRQRCSAQETLATSHVARVIHKALLAMAEQYKPR